MIKLSLEEGGWCEADTDLQCLSRRGETSEGLEEKKKQSTRTNILDLFANIHNTPTLAKQKRGLVFINLPACNSKLSVLKVWVD